METERMAEANGTGEDVVRFEDLTVDDDLPIVERVVKYMNSQIALQRLVHIKMLAETAELAGSEQTMSVLLPAVKKVLSDAEAVIRQHLAAQLLPLAIVCMIEPDKKGRCTVQDRIQQPGVYRVKYIAAGYKAVTVTIVDYLNVLIEDAELEVRRAAADSLAGIALQIKSDDVAAFCLPIPLRFAVLKSTSSNPNSSGKKKSEADQHAEDLRITACNLLAEMGGAPSEHAKLLSSPTSSSGRSSSVSWVSSKILPAVLKLCDDPSFRVRRSAAQALPRIVGSCTLEDASTKIVPAFDKLSQDELYRVRKSAGECLVDMSRSLMILAYQETDEKRKQSVLQLRRTKLLPIADRLIQDSHKMVRQGMMQFLGPFMASFYPYQYTTLQELLPVTVESDGSTHLGIVAQFFPHASSMVSRLNSSQNAITTAPTPVYSNINAFAPKPLSLAELAKKTLPSFIQAARMSALSLAAVSSHRQEFPPDQADIDAVMDTLLDYFAALAIVSTGDENTDAEMRVYCAYSFPAIVLLLGPENWQGALKTCFLTLLNPNFALDDEEDNADSTNLIEPPLPVKRCLASSLHTVAHVLGPNLAAADILPVFYDYFLRDPDDSVRSNVIRNFPALLKLLPTAVRKEAFCQWSQVVFGEEFLGAKKRSATNPVVLNWRQRDHLARSLPDLVSLVSPLLIQEHLWPILQLLLCDPVNDVRDDALWTLPILVTAYCPDNVQKWDIGGASEARAFSSKACADVITWVKDKFLKTGIKSKQAANFSERQLYCRICCAFGLALRFHQEATTSSTNSGSKALSDKVKSFLFSSDVEGSGPYQKLTSSEQKHLKKLLQNDLLPAALELKEDLVSNVRISLRRALQLLPDDIKATQQVRPALKSLIEDSDTWESFGPEAEPLDTVGSAVSVGSSEQSGISKSITGPVDTDITPQSSRDEAVDDESTDSSVDSEEDHNEDKKMDSYKPVASVQSKMAGVVVDHDRDERSVLFEDGPIGMQLEPTPGEKSCRVYGFLDSGPDDPSPARVSGKVFIGDVIRKVNGEVVQSYDATILKLRAGGRRLVTFSPGTEEELQDTADDATETTASDEEAERRARKEAKKAKKAKKEAKKAKKAKKEAKEAKKKKT